MSEGMEMNPVTEAAQAVSFLELHVQRITDTLKHMNSLDYQLEKNQYPAVNIHVEIMKAKEDLKKITIILKYFFSMPTKKPY